MFNFSTQLSPDGCVFCILYSGDARCGKNVTILLLKGELFFILIANSQLDFG